ncbi:hypothetical protein JGI7_00829 [Candidatus Kryptonium thompsonii]|uniref:Uncharacterized protein n=1 Tax=Candidatus Kryptonium thompsonii TaxID=1633631 RepID=A0A0P1LFB2_9BACT|nr:hypothetical protein [Candidatus Kryptonium thompsoni]CUS78548.1 hypothetical protein JGI14_100432 [Candidatus Kryptonium thompsoni]CUS79679.1 hypothetical protein JGI15_100622 [Candidatus Kryptonium thompsoni]CUS82184.1 hypothetical protein JGI16_104412 [Candidatus Kryptonium thompsoni]CUS84756.1 hypothetical protein JGI7_00829 [Candidatus Kryptonium thompsoni]CUS84984.1 hypothetical protein JGI6_00117 [Candidatus Kryptonium thompsoni]
MKFTTEGIIFMVLAWGIVATLTIYCFAKVLKTKVGYNNNQDED